MTTSPEPDTGGSDTVGGPDAVEQALLQFLAKRTGRVWSSDTEIFGPGGLSSLFAMELVVHLEKTYDIVIRGADLWRTNFRSVAQIVDLVERLRQPAPGGTDG